MLDILFNDILIDLNKQLIAFAVETNYDSAKESINQYCERKKDIHKKQKEQFTSIADKVTEKIPSARTCVVWDSYDYNLTIMLPMNINNPNVPTLLQITLPFCNDACQTRFAQNYPELMELYKKAPVTKAKRSDDSLAATRSTKSDTQIVCTLGLHSLRVVEEAKNTIEECKSPCI